MPPSARGWPHIRTGPRHSSNLCLCRRRNYPLWRRLPSNTVRSTTSYDPRFDHLMRMLADNRSNHSILRSFYCPKGSWYIDPEVVQESIDNLFEFDASPDVLVALAHDPESGKYFESFPNGIMNGWKKKAASEGRMNWKEASPWCWLNELPGGGKPGRPPLVNGHWDESKQQTRTLDDVTKIWCKCKLRHSIGT